MTHHFESTAIVPSYNRSSLICYTIDSLLDQTSPFSEIIVVDDGSTDNTLDVLARYGDKIRIIRTERLGVQNARNTGARAARSEWLTYCDSDDLLRPGYVARCRTLAQRATHVDLMYANFRAFRGATFCLDAVNTAPANFFADATLVDGWFVDTPNLTSKLIDYQPLWPTGMSIRKARFEAIGGYDTSLRGLKSEDFEFTLRAVSQLSTAISHDVLVHYRLHDSNVSSDRIGKAIGGAVILERALSYVPALANESDKVRRSIAARRRSALNMAYAAGQFSLLEKSLDNLPITRLQPAELVKVAVARMPEWARGHAWRWTRRLSQAIGR